MMETPVKRQVQAVSERVREMPDRLAALDRQVQSVASERPLLALAAALAAGFVLGRLLSRR